MSAQPGDGHRHEQGEGRGDGHDHPHDHDHRHDHGHGHGLIRPPDGGLRRLALSLVLTATVMVAEAVGGWMSGSLALVSDAGHMLTDAGALGLALVAAWLSTRRADDRRTYGWRRAEVLGAQLNVAALLGLTAWIAWEAVARLRAPERPIDVGLMAVVAAIGLAANLAILVVLRHEHGLNARSAFLHVVADTVSSVAILLGAGLLWLRPAWTWLDPVLSLVISALILFGALRLIREITDILMESVPGHLDRDEVARGMAGADAGVLAVHDLHIWTISSGLYALSAHLTVDGAALARSDEILTAVKVALRQRWQIDHSTLQIESADYPHVHDVCDGAH
jgi:cobalt-zinc-cadmium efflux system protein